MKIMIAGGGYNGTTIAKYFVNEKHNEITIIDINEKVINKITSSMPLGGIVGGVTDMKALESANIKSVDLFISTCPNDETNLFACAIVSDVFQVKTKIAKVINSNYFSNHEMYNYLHSRHNKLTNIDHLIIPNVHVIENIIHRMTYCSSTIVAADGIDTTAIKLLSVKCFKNSLYIDKKVKDILEDLQGSVAVLGIKRAKDFIIDNIEEITLQEDDIIQIMVNKNEIKENIETLTAKNCQKYISEQGNKEVVIVGGNKLSVSLAKEIHRYNVGKIDIIVSDFAKAKKLSHELNSYGINVININLENKENIEQINLKPNSYYFVNEDKEEDTVIICFLLRQYGAKNIYSYLDSDFYYNMLTNYNILHVLSSEKFIVADIIPFVRSGIIYNAKVIENDYELLYVEIVDGCGYSGRSVKYVRGNGIKVLGIVENDKLVMVKDEFILSDKTRMLILYNKEQLSNVEHGLDAYLN